MPLPDGSVRCPGYPPTPGHCLGVFLCPEEGLCMSAVVEAVAAVDSIVSLGRLWRPVFWGCSLWCVWSCISW